MVCVLVALSKWHTNLETDLLVTVYPQRYPVLAYPSVNKYMGYGFGVLSLYCLRQVVDHNSSVAAPPFCWWEGSNAVEAYSFVWSTRRHWL